MSCNSDFVDTLWIPLLWNVLPSILFERLLIFATLHTVSLDLMTASTLIHLIFMGFYRNQNSH
jgi:hypothetical protein